MMKRTKFIFVFLTATFLMYAPSCYAVPSFDTGNLVMHLKELVKQEGRNKMMKFAGEYIKLANSFMDLMESVQHLAMVETLSITPPEQWTPIVPKNVAPLLEVDEPDLGKVQGEISKIVFLDKTTPETLRRTDEQQRVLLLKILSYSYAASEASLAASANAEEDLKAFRKRIDETKKWQGKVGVMAILQMYSTRKVKEILNLQSRLLEVNSILSLMNKEKPKETLGLASEPPQESKENGKGGSDQTTAATK